MKVQLAPWLMLPFRLIFFAFFQGVFALFFFLGSTSDPWESSVAWWPFSVIITNVLCICILVMKARQNNERFLAQFRFNRDTLKQDLFIMAGVLVGSVLLVMGPNIGLAIAIFQDPQAGLKLMDHPLPIWATILSFLFLPVTQLFAEIPTYMSYISPELQKQGIKPWFSVLLASLFLSLQHIAMPLILDPFILIYKATMFLLFALFLGILLHYRIRLLPYVVIMHGLMDLQLLITAAVF